MPKAGGYLVVHESGDRLWAFRFTDLHGKRAQMESAKIGDRDSAAADVLTLSSARHEAREYKVALKRGGLDTRAKKWANTQLGKRFKEFAQGAIPRLVQGSV
jgi:hypothetical protein